MSNKTFDIWVEKYRPNTLDGYVFKDESMREQIEDWIKNPQGKKIPIPHILLTGSPGTGKTTLARMLVHELGVSKGDVLEINASRESNVETVRSKIVNFCETWPIGDYKVLILDEMDGFSAQAQMILRAEVERHSDSARFIMTANYANKIIPALHSRFQSFHIDSLDTEAFMTRAIEILIAEDVQFEPDDLGKFVEASYPDLRKCINLLDQHTVNGVLKPIKDAGSSSLDYMDEFVTLFMAKKYLEARQLICSSVTATDFEDVYRYFYRHLDLFSNTVEGQNTALVLIARALRDHSLVADPEINLAALCVELSQIGQ